MALCKSDRDRFIEENLRLVHAVCKRFTGKGIEYDDLFQAGCLGLVKAADAFDTTRGVCFSTYAFPVIMGEIKRLFRDGGTVKISRTIKELGLKINAEKERLEQKLDREPTVVELAERLGVSAEEITEAICALQPTLSLTIDEEGGMRESDIPSVSTEEAVTDRLTIDAGMANLDETEKKIVQCRYFLSMTQSKTAEILSMTQVQVSRKEKVILGKMRQALIS